MRCVQSVVRRIQMQRVHVAVPEHLCHKVAGGQDLLQLLSLVKHHVTTYDLVRMYRFSDSYQKLDLGDRPER
jgi:hypothetical protein